MNCTVSRQHLHLHISSSAVSEARGVRLSTCMLLLLERGVDSLMPLQTSCSFAGAWGGGQLPKAFYVSSYFWDRALEAGELKEPDPGSGL